MKLCANPLNDAVLADYWFGSLPEEEEEATEMHLLRCDECGAQLRRFVTLAEAIRRVGRSGNLRVVVSESLLREAESIGLRVRSYSVSAGGAVDCTVTAEDDLLVARLAVERTGGGPVDLCWCDEAGTERARLPDVPVGAEVILNVPIAWARAMGPDVLVMRLVAVEAAGEQVLGEYTFRHQPS